MSAALTSAFSSRLHNAVFEQEKVRLRHQQIARAVAKVDQQLQKEMDEASAALNSVEETEGVAGRRQDECSSAFTKAPRKEMNRDLAVMAASDSAKVARRNIYLIVHATFAHGTFARGTLERLKLFRGLSAAKPTRCVVEVIPSNLKCLNVASWPRPAHTFETRRSWPVDHINARKPLPIRGHEIAPCQPPSITSKFGYVRLQSVLLGCRIQVDTCN